jgi:hypothetical protein
LVIAAQISGNLYFGNFGNFAIFGKLSYRCLVIRAGRSNGSKRLDAETGELSCPGDENPGQGGGLRL